LTKTYKFLINFIPATCPIKLIFFNLIILMFGKQRKLGFSNFLLRSHSWVQISSSLPCSLTPSINVFLSVWEATFHIHIKLKLKDSTVYFNSYIFRHHMAWQKYSGTNWKNYGKFCNIHQQMQLNSWALLTKITVFTVVKGFLSNIIMEYISRVIIFTHWKHIPNIPIKLFSFAKFKGVTA
jgi:hypothetical protein